MSEHGDTFTADEVAVGDLNSDAPGSGARKNAGKAQMDLVPVKVWLLTWGDALVACGDASTMRLFRLLATLRDWQEGDNDALSNYFSTFAYSDDMDEAVKVFEFGAEKYKAWNWAKGMPWSVPTGCILRHAKKILDGELIDDESGHSHLGHIICNMIMLHRYLDEYPEGDDRPPRRET